jgi:proline iminopeptidase
MNTEELPEAPIIDPVYIETSGGRIACYVHDADADGIPVIFVHGGPGAGSSLGLTEALDLGRPMYFYDQLGCGLSDSPADPGWYSLDNYVDELCQVVDALGLGRFILYGSSWGGMLATAYLVEHGTEDVEALVLASPLLSSPMWDADQMRNVSMLPPDVADAIARCEREADYGPAYRRALVEYYRIFLFRHGDEQFFEEALTAGYSESALALCGPSEFVMHGPLSTVDLFPELHDIRIPVLILCGDHDCLRVETALEYAREFPDAELCVLPDAGHMLRKDQPEIFAAAIERFLSLRP